MTGLILALVLGQCPECDALPKPAQCGAPGICVWVAQEQLPRGHGWAVIQQGQRMRGLDAFQAELHLRQLELERRQAELERRKRWLAEFAFGFGAGCLLVYLIAIAIKRFRQTNEFDVMPEVPE